MTRSIRFHIFLMLALTTAVPALPQKQGGVDILLAKARSLEARGLTDLAAENWRKVLLANPNQTEALAGLARAAKEKGQLDQEKSYLDRLRKIDPHDPQIAAVEKLRVFTPQERSQLDQAGRLAMQHKPDDAMKIYHQVLGDQPPPGQWEQSFYETEAASTGGRERAISQLRELCEQNPNRETYRLWLASLLTYDPKTRMEGLQLFASIKDPGIAQQARPHWRQALIWEKENPDVLAPMEAYLQRYPDQDMQPIVAALRAKQQQNIADADKALAFKELRNKDVQAADARFTKVLSQSPNDPNAVVGLAYVRLDEGRFSDALSLFERARTLAPQRQDVREGYDSARFSLAMTRGAEAQQQKQPQVAIAAYQDALAIRPSDNGAVLGIANALVQEKNFSAAEMRFQEVLSKDPNNADAMAGLGFVRLNEGRFNDATNLLAEAHKLNPTRADVNQGYHNAKFWGIMNQASSALNQNRAKDAVAAYQQALLLDPTDKDALRGLANASERMGNFPTAARTYQRLIAVNPNDESAWLDLIRAQIGEKDVRAAISTPQHIPPAVRQQMETRSDYLSEMSLVYYETNQPGEGDRFLRRALDAAKNSDSDDALGLRLQIAGAFIDQGKMGSAIDIFRQATQSHPNNASGWEGLVGAYTRLGEISQAITTVRSMPQSSYDAAVKNTGFLDSVALLYSTLGQCAEAEDFLHRSLAMDQSNGHPPAEGTQLQLADILMRRHNYNHSETLYSEIVARDSNSVAAWRGFLVVLHEQRADRTLATEIPKMPSSVRTQLETDPSFIVLEASAYSTAGRNQDALPLLQKARSEYTAHRKSPPAMLEIQTAWTMLAVSVDEPGLGDLLLKDKARTDLTSKERQAIEEIYSNWSVRRAELVFESKPELSFSILTDAGRQYPSDRNIHAALASLYLKRHDKQRALDTFQSWGMAGAQAGDYRMAAGAALSAHKNELADQYLKRGLARFPTDPELMHMTARQDIARGDYDEGERELRAALLAVRETDTAAPQAQALALSNMEPSAVPANPAGAVQSASSCKPEPPRGTANEARIRPISLVLFVSQAQSQEPQEDSGQQSQSQQSPAQPSAPQQQTQPQTQQQQIQPQTPQQQQQEQQQTTQPQDQPQTQKQQQEAQMEDEVEALSNRNTPVISIGGVGMGRLGDPGIDRLIVSDSVLGGAYTALNKVRFGIEAHGVFAYSGTPDGSSKLMFGTLPAGATFGEQSKTGYSGVGQLSTQTFGMMFGTTPQGFAVHNFIGGVRYRPLNGWFTFEGVRDSVKDSLLSYAGSRDPGTGIRWGGVVSNTGTVKFDSAPRVGSAYKAFGEYASANYSFLQGLRVPNNWSVSANAGIYWQMVPGLTIGVNATGMHYNKNLSFFSFGQGGYFSPQQYYLGSIPIQWYSRHPRFEYQVRFSGGVQYLHEDTSPFYPVLPASATVVQGTYASNSSTSPNYDADIRMGYRVAPHMYLDAFATANNSQNYYSQSAGFSLRFTLDPIPTTTDVRINSIPDWTGNQPFSIH